MTLLTLLLALGILALASCTEPAAEPSANCQEIVKKGRECVEWMTREELERDAFDGLTLAEMKAEIAGMSQENAENWARTLAVLWEASLAQKCKRQAHEDYPGTGRREFSICEGSPTDFDKLLTEGESVYGHAKEELIIRHFFRDRPNGFYVDIGCFHWKNWSTTFYLEEHLGWSGIGVNAQKIYRRGWRKHRPRSKFIALAVTDKSDEEITFYQFGGISSTDKQNIEKWQKTRKFEPKGIKVPTITMNDLLEREGVKKIDFLSMDINGGEVTALAGFDVKRYRPDLVHIEVQSQNARGIAEYFEKNDYERIDAYRRYDRDNWYLKPKAVADGADPSLASDVPAAK